MSQQRSLLAIAITLLFAPQAMARPLDQSRALHKVIALDPSGRSDLPSARSGIMNAATAGTTFYGGTFWAADSQRWEAYENQLWTFDSGVGSSLVPPGGPGGLSQPTADLVNPYKQPGLHATMEGWIGVDRTYSEITYFRRVASSDPRFSGVACTGSIAGLGGTYSYWCGVFPSEAAALCYSAGQGYGNSWRVCIERGFSYPGGGATLGFQYKNDTEDAYDYTHVYVDTSSNGDDVEVISFTGVASGTESILLTQGVELPLVPKPIKIKFCVTTDGAWSDEDGLNATACGAFALDNVLLSGAIAHAADFESSGNGWVLAPPPPGPGGEWSNLYHIDDLPPTLSPLFACPCALYDSVLAFHDNNNSHNAYTDNMAVSPWVDLKAYGAVGATGKIVRANTYAYLPIRNYIFTAFEIQYYPYKCLNTGKLVTSPWSGPGIFYFGSPNYCTSTVPGDRGVQIDLSGSVDPGAEQVRIALGVFSWCRFFTNCTVANASPWYDLAGLGVYGNPDVPFLFADELDRAQDNFPENGTLNYYATGRVDSNNIQGDSQPEVSTTLGDTLIVTGAVGSAEVYVHFRVNPGPGTHPSLLQTWLQKHASSVVEPGFRRARLDTAEFGGSGPLNGNWMTAYHELDPNFSGNDRTLDPTDVSPTGGIWRLKNDIFPDHLFTAGTRLDYFFTANNTGQTSYVRDPGSGYHEMEILPSSMSSQETWNCVLYVDHFNGGAQGFIENALTSILGTGSENAEGTNWDRYDVNAAASAQASFGRPLQTDYGATVVQALGYRTLLWDSGNLNAFTLTKEDADVLLPWLTLSGFGEHNLYLSGDGVVFSPIAEEASEPSARHLVEELVGVTIKPGCATGTYRSTNCPFPGAPLDMTACVNLEPLSGALVANQPTRGVGHVGQGNGCPQLRSFDVFSLLTPEAGTITGDEKYSTSVKFASFASAATQVSGEYRIVVDGLSVSHRRDSGTACDYLLGGTTAVTERLSEVLTYFGYASTSNPACMDVAGSVGTDLPQPLPIRKPTALSRISPNPIAVGQSGRIQFVMERDAAAKIDIFNLEGRLVRSVYDGPAKEGENETSWDGRDDSGAYVGNGVYFYRLRALGLDLSHKMVVVDSRN